MDRPPADRDGYRLGYRAELDGMRGIAVLLVMGYHFAVPGMEGGGHTGVAIFFVLSGYLITSLLLEEWATSGRVDLAAFYLRRARRLLPALVALIVVLLIVAAARGSLAEVAGQAAIALLYASNWALAVGMALDGLTHTWSLSVEEQFYLAWPAALLACLFIGRRSAAVALALTAGAAAVVLRVLRPDLHIGVDRIDALMAGCLLALLTRDATLPRIPSAIGWLGVVTLAAGAVLPFTLLPVRVWGLLVIAAAATLVIAWTLQRDGAASRVLRAAPLVATGRISYGLYLWHVPIAIGLLPQLQAAGMAWPLSAALLSSVTLFFAILSWRYVERPFRLRRAVPRRQVAEPRLAASV